MFKKSNNNNIIHKNDTITKDYSPMKIPANSVPSIISADVIIKGNISTSGEIQLDGTVEGDIKSNSLTIGESGKVKGKITADDVVVKGSVNGSVNGRNIRLEKTARISGDLCHQTLSIEAGAKIEGNLSHQDSNPKTVPNNTTKVVSSGDEKKTSVDEEKTLAQKLI